MFSVENENVFHENEEGVFKFLRFSKKLRFRDGLVWTVDLTGEIKIRFQIFLAECGHCLNLMIFGFLYD